MEDYKEKLRLAKEALDSGSYDKDTIEYIFPELKESEDEKIRKEIISYIKNSTCQVGNAVYNSWIAWLEKQGEQKTEIKYIYPKFRVGDIVKSKSQPMLEPRKIISIGKDCYWCEDRGCIGFAWEDDCEIVEQKPVDKVEPKFRVKYAGNEYNVLEIKDIGGVTFYGIEDEPNHIDYVLPENCEIVSDYGYGVKEKGSPYPTKSAIFSEQKPAWSEEDEQMFILCASSVKTRYNDGLLTYNEYEQASLWLKSLKERMKGE